MLRPWMRLLPRFAIRWYALKHCEVFTIGGKKVVSPFPGVQFEIDQKQ